MRRAYCSDISCSSCARSGSGSAAAPRVPSARSVSKARPSAAASAADAKKLKDLEQKNTSLKLSVDSLSTERDFYFGKLRDIEILCTDKSLANNQVVQAVQTILYATEEYDIAGLIEKAAGEEEAVAASVMPEAAEPEAEPEAAAELPKAVVEEAAAAAASMEDAAPMSPWPMSASSSSVAKSWSSSSASFSSSAGRRWNDVMCCSATRRRRSDAPPAPADRLRGLRGALGRDEERQKGVEQLQGRRQVHGLAVLATLR